MMENKKTKKEKDNTIWKLITILLLIIIIILLLLRSCGTDTANISDTNNKVEIEIENPIGDFEVTDEKQEQSKEDVNKPTRTISFSGYGEYTVSKDKPNLELRNPEVNFVDMVFEVVDAKSGEIIARTDKVSAGKFVYVNAYDFYDGTVGAYAVNINISTYDSETGAPKNGMNQEMKLIIK